MESNYDEDLCDNIFFQVLQTDHFDLFQRATVDGWVICVPRLGSLPKYALTHDDFFSHILIPSDELPETHFRSLNDKDIRICNRVVTVESTENTSFSTHVLFEETFYTEDMLKYKVLCIENPLQYYSESNKSELTIINVQTLRDCIDLLWMESSGKDVLLQMDEAIAGFLCRNPKLEFKKIDVQRDLVNNLYDQCLQIVLHNKHLHEKTLLRSNRHLLESVKISVESYIHHGIYKKLIKGITACTATEDSSLNKIIRNLTDIQLRDLDIRLDLYDAIPRARRELARIDGYSTVLGKVGCLKRTLSAISKQDSTSSEVNIVAADDLLPILIFLVIKSGIANWIAHLTYMKQFCFSSLDEFHIDQHSFLVTSLEAAIEHVNSGSLLCLAPEAQLDYFNKNLTPLYQSFEMQNVFNENSSKIPEKLANLFEFARLGDIEKIVEILNKPKSDEKNVFDASKLLCHPLCSCDKCEFQISMTLVNTVPTVHSCDDRGFTVLHIASMFGQPKVVDLLIGFGANVNAVDQSGETPLHYACTRGHQNELLLLLHSGAKFDIFDNEGNTPLHCASNNGHEGCVKALLYFSEQSCYKLEVNKKNNHGETALHSAARWGYKLIVKTLLDYGANPMAENKRKMTPLDYAHNLHISQLLTSTPRYTNLRLIIPQFKTEKSDIQVAAASQTRLDFTDEDKPQSPKGKLLEVGDRPNTIDQIKKVDRLLKAIAHGDIHLSCFYLGLEGSLVLKHNCHPLCECKQKKKDTDEFGESKSPDVLNVNICNADGFTPLHIAAMQGRIELIQILLKARAFTNVQTRKGLTPLHLACQNQRIQIIQLLLDAYCDINSQDNRGNTALHYACDTKNVRVVELLMKYKPNCNLRNSEGRTALDVTEDNMCLTLTRLLSEGML